MFAQITFVLFSLVASGTGALFGQTPAPTPVPQVCGPILDIAVGSHGYILNSCETNGKASAWITGQWADGGFVSDMTNVDGSIILAVDDGRIVRNRLGTTQWFATHRLSYFIRSNFDEVVTASDTLPNALSYAMNIKGSLQVTPEWQEPMFPTRCTQFINTSYGHLYCVDRNNQKISRAIPRNPNTKATPTQAMPWFEMQGLEYAREYKDGLLVLVRDQYECAAPPNLPEDAIFCYTPGLCKQTSAPKMLFVRGDKAEVTELPFKLSVIYSSTFTVRGDFAYVVESEFGDKLNWIGDWISKINLITGTKTVYLSREDLAGVFDGGRMADLWIN